MKTKTYRHTLAVLLGCILYAISHHASAETIDYGLTFRSHDVDQDSRTSLHLSPLSHFRMKDGFTLSFDIRLYELYDNFGYVFRIVSGGHTSLDMAANLLSDRYSFILSHDHKVEEKLSTGALDSLRHTDWHRITVTIGQDGGISCKVGESEYVMKGKIRNLKDIDIIFGWSDHHVYYTTDVAPMSLRNVTLSPVGDKAYSWPLFRHNVDEVYDCNRNCPASVKDGVWLVDRHSRWAHEKSLRTSAGVPMLAYDQSSSRLFIATPDSVHRWSLSEGTSFSEKCLKGTPIRHSGNQMIYDPVEDRLVCFSMHDNRTAEYDLSTGIWTGSFREEWPPMMGHSHIFDRDSSRIYVFGGYGNHTYTADFTTLDIRTGERVTTDISDHIWPRYFASMGRDENGDFIVLGGFGNASGYQEESPGNLSDVVRIDGRTLECTKIGSFAHSGEPFVFGSSLLYDKGRIYSLAFNNSKYKTQLRLVALDCKDKSPLVMYADPIDFCFRDTDSWAALVLDRDRTKLYSVILSAIGRGLNDVRVCSLSYPPLLPSEILQTPPRKFPFIPVASALLSVLVVAAVVLFRKYRLRRRIRHQIMDDEGIPFTISLIGGFRIVGKNGEDLTSRLSSVPRQLLIYFILRYMGSKSKVTSSELDEKFWYGMERSQIINNRNVNIRKLRVVLNEVGNIRVLYNNETWTLDIGPDVLCDYCILLPLLRKVVESDNVMISDISMILSCSRKGTLLTGYDYEWLDKYKAAYSDLLVSAMMKISRHPFIASDPELMIRVADCIMKEDCIDEFAVKTKCRILYSIGQKGKSKQVYDQYVADYKRLLNSDPEISYSEMLR